MSEAKCFYYCEDFEEIFAVGSRDAWRDKIKETLSEAKWYLGNVVEYKNAV